MRYLKQLLMAAMVCLLILPVVVVCLVLEFVKALALLILWCMSPDMASKCFYEMEKDDDEPRKTMR